MSRQRRGATTPGFYEPLAGVDELHRLERRWLHDQATFRRWLLGAAALAVLLVALNLLGTAFDPALSRALRAWSLFPVLTLALLLTPLATRDYWLRCRALVAQRRLLAHRGLLGRESDIRAAEERIGEELSALSPTDSRAEAALRAARKESRRLLDKLSRIGLERRRHRESGQQRDQSERRLITRLDAYEQALETISVEAVLEPTLLSSGAATEALERARCVLALPDEIAPTAAVRPAEEQPDYSVAVLPFTDLSPEADQEYFANGLAEELISALTKIRGLRVIARSSAFSLRGEDTEPSEIGARLKVNALIRGSVRKAGERLRVTIQLVETSEGRLLWSERYDGEMDDVFSIQDQLTASVIDHLSADLAGVPAQLTSGRTTDVDAYHFYLRGRHLWNKRTPADLRDSLHYFEEAISRDQKYALAYSGLADSYNLLGYYSILAPKESFPQAHHAARQALEIDDTLAEAHCSLAFVMLLHDWDWSGAEREFRRTLELNPGYATAHHWFAECLTLTGRQDEAVTRAAAALELDPLSPIINVLVGWVYYYARRYDEAVEALEAALRIDPDFAPAEFWLGLTYEQKGRLEEARTAFDRAISHADRSPMLLAALARLLAEQGETTQADALLEELRTAAQASYVPAYYMAAVYSGYGKREQALEWLETSLRDRESWMVFLNVDPIWDPYRQEERFEALVQSVGLEE